MLLADLLERLKHPDQWVRVETLRILAMVEEAEALPAIAHVYKNDPEAGVRHVAQWAGQLIYAAQRSQTAQPSAAETPLTPSQEALIASLIEKDHRTYDEMQFNLQQHLREQNRSAPPPAPPPANAPLDLMRLLDEGLSDEFFS
ncbi:MAG: HEAT repeat domain-containing protein [Chloroflexi bacterium CFX4]|nr:HEAT repeat domain-containing protein [Chloroflexi bacterium CFX4]MDL1921482.1 HEAT repeat domain-containing protein [Chloroflexi bacterium CFX3]